MVHVLSKAPVKCKFKILHMSGRLGNLKKHLALCFRMANPENFILERVWWI